MKRVKSFNDIDKIQLKGSIKSMHPKCNILANKEKLSFFELTKYKKDINLEQIESHRVITTVNKHILKRG
jgi:hypothetical protein